MSFEATDAQSIKKAQEFLNKANVKNELLYIKTHFKIIADAIEQLETIGLKLNQSMEIVEKVYTSLKNTPGKVGEMAFQKLCSLLKKNPGYDFICSVNNVICGNGNATNNTYINENVDCSIFNFAPITSCDVERTFSKLKSVLSDQRCKFTIENLEKYIVCFCNSF